MDPALLTGCATRGSTSCRSATTTSGTVVAGRHGHDPEPGQARDPARRGGGNTTAARHPAWLTAGGLRIAILAYNGVWPDPNATSTRRGGGALTLATIRADIRAARAAGADVVMVVPHWGVEYTDRITPQQASLGPALLKAGADLVLGDHSHWAGPIRLFGSGLVVYSMGDLVFDLVHDARTQQGILVESPSRAGAGPGRPPPDLNVGRCSRTCSRRPGGGSALLQAIHAGSKRLGSP